MAQVNALILENIQKFLVCLNEQGIHVDAAYLFGSYAKGRENKWSDIDVAVISADLSEDRFKERVRLMRISFAIDSRIEPVPFRPDAFVDEDPLAWEIRRHGIQV